MMDKQVVVYALNSVFHYTFYPEDYLYEIDEKNNLRIFFVSREREYKEELVAVFKNWDYFFVE